MLNFVICEDNLNILTKLSNMLENIFLKYNYDAKVELATDKPDNLVEYICANNIDVVLLDINLKAKKTGLELAQEIRQKNKSTYIIFITGHLEYAMVAYKYKTFDYISKPINQERLEETITRLFDDVYSKPKKYLKIDNKNTIIDESEINYIKRDGMKLVFCTDSRDYEIYSSFNKIKDTLPKNFVRCHKSYIANIDKISNLEPVENRIIFNNSNFSCDIGPKYKNNLMEAINNYGILE
ncbi:MAG: response regulator transcription factor [Clostridia bacterium]|nr:response regulator transcription factor [Clostridia bacterium]